MQKKLYQLQFIIIIKDWQIHLADVEISKSNILLIGPTGTGKTY